MNPECSTLDSQFLAAPMSGRADAGRWACAHTQSSVPNSLAQKPPLQSIAVSNSDDSVGPFPVDRWPAAASIAGPPEPPLPVLSYRRPDSPRPERFWTFRRRMRWLLAGFWLAQFCCLVWLLMCASMIVSTLVELCLIGPYMPPLERASELAVELLAIGPGVLLLVLLRASRRRHRRLAATCRQRRHR